ncbi:MAG: D-glycero-beta-D-manno-heptose-7-phosphate kinase [Elusimicrobiales bacterium]|nr:D-glycero-beta-D-manno-heptose-7-phosphate kinase [Elusimicrobiales bacterium]
MENLLYLKDEIFEIISNFSKVSALVIGDVMLDHYVFGKVRRISPEAPVPVVEVTKEKFLPGGAANVCANIASLGSKVNLITVIGEDSIANKVIELTSSINNINTSFVLLDSNYHTIQKTRIIAEHQQVVRVDYETKFEYYHSIKNKIKDNIKKAIEISDVVILSDYGKGILSKDIIAFSIYHARKKNIPIFVDPKIEHFLAYRNVTSMTPNIQEAFGGMRKIEKARDDKAIEEIGKKIIKKLSLKTLIITRSEQGMSVFDNSSSKLKITHIPTTAKEVFDVTGAGDTVISVAAISYVVSKDILKSAFLSNYAAGIVVSKIGAATVNQDELKKVFQ